MPKYEFRCLDCGSQVEVEGSITESIKAPECDSCHYVMVRVYSPTAAVFKGTGWGKDK